MNDEAIKSDWLAGNAAIAFFAALIIAQTHRSTTGRTELVFGFDIPSIPTWWTDSAIAILIVISITLTFAGTIPPLRQRTIQFAKPLVPTLEFLTWAAFLTGFANSLEDLPKDQWWSAPLIYGGLLFTLFLFFRFLVTVITVMRYWLTRIQNPESSR